MILPCVYRFGDSDFLEWLSISHSIHDSIIGLPGWGKVSLIGGIGYLHRAYKEQHRVWWGWLFFTPAKILSSQRKTSKRNASWARLFTGKHLASAQEVGSFQISLALSLEFSFLMDSISVKNLLAKYSWWNLGAGWSIVFGGSTSNNALMETPRSEGGP